MERKLCSFWKQNSTEADNAKIKELAGELAGSLKSMDKDSVDRLLDSWVYESRMLRQAASEALDYAAWQGGPPSDEVKVAVMEHIAKALAYNEMIKTVEARRNIVSQPPPERAAGETLESYKRRLSEYADSLHD